MNQALLYIIKAAFYIAAFYLVYYIFLSRDTLYARNRAFIMLSIAASLILPLITIKTGKPVNIPLFGRTLNEVLITGERTGNRGTFDGLSKYQFLLLFYLTGVAFAAIKMFSEIRGLLRILAKSSKKGNRVVIFGGIRTAAFTAFGHIFINESLPNEVANEVLRHEQNHLDKNHSFDIMLMQLLKVLQWFNPFIYMFDRSLHELHEYQADEKCINAGTTVSSYQQLLMNQVLETSLFSISNSFSNPTLIKKRMIMMTKERSGLLANLKILMVLPVVAVVMLAFSSCGEKSKTSVSTKTEIQSPGTPVPPPPPPPPPPFDIKNGDTTWVSVDANAEFKGGDQGLLQYINENIKYPESAKKNGITGKVIVRFAVEADGKVDKVAILKGVSPELDAEAIRVVSGLPQYLKPGMVKGRPVAVWYMVPINFTLK